MPSTSSPKNPVTGQAPGPPTPADQVVSTKAASILARGEPNYLVDVLGQHAGREPETEEGER